VLSIFIKYVFVKATFLFICIIDLYHFFVFGFFCLFLLLYYWVFILSIWFYNLLNHLPKRLNALNFLKISSIIIFVVKLLLYPSRWHLLFLSQSLFLFCFKISEFILCKLRIFFSFIVLDFITDDDLLYIWGLTWCCSCIISTLLWDTERRHITIRTGRDNRITFRLVSIVFRHSQGLSFLLVVLSKFVLINPVCCIWQTNRRLWGIFWDIDNRLFICFILFFVILFRKRVFGLLIFSNILYWIPLCQNYKLFKIIQLYELIIF